VYATAGLETAAPGALVADRGWKRGRRAFAAFGCLRFFR
jgi:hypothetical protein